MPFQMRFSSAGRCFVVIVSGLELMSMMVVFYGLEEKFLRRGVFNSPNYVRRWFCLLLFCGYR